jgi:hypothetical protein
MGSAIVQEASFDTVEFDDFVPTHERDIQS